MKVAEMVIPPDRAGLATLHFEQLRPLYDQSNLSRRDGSVITLVTSERSEFIPLMEGEQFLFTEGVSRRGVFFGGTDERPFLVPLEPEALEIHQTDGETGFYEALKPEIVRKFEQQFGQRTKRQGDIFAFPVLSPEPPAANAAIHEKIEWHRIEQLDLPDAGQPLDWWQTIQLMLAQEHHLPHEEVRIEYKNVRQPLSVEGWQSVLGTRHLLHGTSIAFGHTITIGEGIVYNSDHKAMVLDGPHFLAQTAMIAAWQPRADVD